LCAINDNNFELKKYADELICESNKDWTRIKEIINKTMKDGVEKPYKSVFVKNIYIEGYEVTVTYAKVFDKIVISDAWIN